MDKYKIIGILGLFVWVVAAWQIRSVTSGLKILHTQAAELPLEIVGPARALDGSRPVVLIAHGFAGSGVIMRGFAYTFAKAGYVAVLWDFDGHAANPRPLPGGMVHGDLLPNAEQALVEVQRLGIADSSRIAILGHSMGSGVALSYGQKHPETMATIAVSPVGVSVTQELPHNLLLLAGSNEPGFLSNARQRLVEAGGEGGDTASGTARKLVVIPGVEHITIVLSNRTYQTARAWLEATFGPQAGAVPYTDRRILWYGLGVVGTLVACLTLVPPTAAMVIDRPPTLRRRVVALISGLLGATLLLWLLGLVGLDLSVFLGMMVGGYLLVWFGLAGIIALALLNASNPWGWWGKKSRDLAVVGLRGLLVGAGLWLGAGWLGGEVWLPWLLIPQRLIWWPVAVAAMLPWFLAVGQVCAPASGWGRAGWWLAHSLMVAGGLYLALQLTPGLFFLLLILPVFPLVLGVQALAAGRQHNAWAFAISGALFISWVVLAVFPLGG